MNTNSLVPMKDQKEKPIFIVEVTSAEKQLWALIQSKGLLHSDVQDLYRQVYYSYEKIILDDHELAELQDVEYSLWKLHYKCIDEFRKRIKRSSANAEISTVEMQQNVSNVQRSNNNYVVAFKSFLSEATEFYQQLIMKIKRCHALPEEFSFCRSATFTSVEPKKMQKCRFLCYRFNVCIGDLARYREQYGNSGMQDHNWSVAATHYLEATMIWPDSGNPQNQLAVLATYVGDDFLALYHCVRSLAVKEPFPDAWDNLVLLLERNRSSHLQSLSSDVHFDFLNPSKRVRVLSKLKSNDDCPLDTDLWSLFIRTTSFFFIKLSLEDFPCAFASTMRSLDELMALDDTKINPMLDSYRLMASTRIGPFRALQVVSIFIFIIQKLINSSEMKGSRDDKDMQQLVSTQLALTTTFVFMGRFVDRCLEAKSLNYCPLLPAVLVFVEWLGCMLDEAETYGIDDKSKSAMSYFFCTFVDLLRQLNVRDDFFSPETTALWEDYELRGFVPVAHAHVSIDFSANWEYIDSFERGTEYRAQRIINAAMKIANRSRDSRKWINYDKLGRKFYAADANGVLDQKDPEQMESASSDFKINDSHQHIFESLVKCEKQILVENASKPSVLGKSVAMEEEEVIVFKPLARYNSAPLYSTITAKDPAPPNDTEDQAVSSDDCLLHATSLHIAQNQVQGDSSVFHPGFTNFKFKQQEPLVKDVSTHPISETCVSAGPPSLSAWVLDRGSLVNDREKGKSTKTKYGLSPIDELVSASFTGLSVSETENSVVSSRHESATTHYSSPYSAPVPSAPLLPDDATWFTSVQSRFTGYSDAVGINTRENFHDVSHIRGHSDWSATPQLPDYGLTIPGLVNGYPPFHGVSSSEWLRQYRENHTIEPANSHTRPDHFCAPEDPRILYGLDASRFGQWDQWQASIASNPMIYTKIPSLHSGSSLAYGVDEHGKGTFIHNYQRPSLYGCGAVTDLRDK
ncbi:EST1_DNA_bind domain-containing protein/EST1 domain-containing protein [Cephalotus follicularis]|uniref:EST1_DNA_bind domain-containing protein/EST1 domain-containing protein n=1 Tax=Cephalotus follicularis TaxID=3775 RepID=A0A1Q3BFH2_CEPFO|nr:EST1_DNA_bind domain-containing protein/EST1 domain-containing protein [Cephalotus follicularis]